MLRIAILVEQIDEILLAMLIDNKVIKLYCEGESNYDYEKYDEHIEMEQYIVNLDSHKRVQPLQRIISSSNLAM